MGARRMKKQRQLYKRQRREHGEVLCAICDLPIIDKSPYLGYLTVDHIIAKSMQGGTTIDNLQPAHQKCNLFKGAIPANEYAITTKHRKQIIAEIEWQREYNANALMLPQ